MNNEFIIVHCFSVHHHNEDHEPQINIAKKFIMMIMVATRYGSDGGNGSKNVIFGGVRIYFSDMF